MRAALLRAVNRIGERMPRRMRRWIADFPGMLGLFQRISAGSLTEVATPEGQRLLLNPLFHANLLSAGGLAGYERDLRQALQVLAKPGMTAYDVGANVGVFSLQLAAIVGEQGAVYAFEPEENNYRCLRATAELNGLAHLRVDTRALGRSTTIESFDRRGGAFSGRLVGTQPDYAGTQNVVRVQTTSIDALVASDGYRPPGLIKIDVEGNEGMVLEGAEETLRQHHPILVCELHGHLGDKVGNVVALLRRHGYRLYALESIASSKPAELEGVPANRHIVAMP